MEIVRTDKEIDEVLNKASESMEHGSKYPGMSYEDGIKNMYEWLCGLIDDDPME